MQQHDGVLITAVLPQRFKFVLPDFITYLFTHFLYQSIEGVLS